MTDEAEIREWLADRDNEKALFGFTPIFTQAVGYIRKLLDALDEAKQEFNPDYLDFQKGVEAGKELGRQEGRREVVEWLAFYEQNDETTVIPVGVLQAKVKEWEADHE